VEILGKGGDKKIQVTADGSASDVGEGEEGIMVTVTE
jgi:hypothetical protein